MTIKKRPLCMIFLLMMLIIYIMHISGLPVPGTFEPPDEILTAVKAGRNIRITGVITQRSIKDGKADYIISKTYLTDDLSAKNLHNIKLYTDETEEILKVGSRITVYGKPDIYKKASNPGGFDAYTYYAADDQWLRLYASRITDVKEPVWPVPEFAAKLKERLRANIMDLCGENNGAVISAMILGEKNELSYDLRSGYTVSGLSHLLAISGLHIGLIGMFLFRLFILMRMKRLPASVLTSAFLFAYSIFTGCAESSMRAFMMFACMSAGKSLLKTYDSLCALSLSGIILLIRSPYTLFRPGFLLSFLAAAGLAVIYPVLRKETEGVQTQKNRERTINLRGNFMYVLRRMTGKAKDGALVWASVQAAVLPVMICCFYELCPYGLIANLVFVPVTGIVLILSLAASLVSLVSMNAAAAVMKIPCIITGYEADFGESLKELPFARITTGSSPAVFVIIYYVSICLAVYLLKNKYPSVRKRILTAVCILLMGIVFIRPDKSSYITALDVGQGDCFIIHTSDDRYFISDGGSSDIEETGRYRIEPYLKSEGIRKIDGIFLSHEDEDHINGIESLLTDAGDGNIDLEVNYVFMSGIMSETQNGQRIKKLAGNCGAKTEVLNAGDIVRDGNSVITVLYPEKEEAAEGNEASMVFKFEDGWFGALFTGDTGFEKEEIILKNLEGTGNTGIVFLKVAHHGSKNSTSDGFLKILRPKVCIISAPEKSFYGHPHRELLERLNSAGAVYLQTGLCGAIRTGYDENGIRITKYLD